MGSTSLKIQGKRQRYLLAPAAYSEAAMPSLKLARSSRFARRIGQCLLVFLILAFLLVAIAPWQQSVTGTGNVLAYTPRERPQVIEAPTEGRVVEWGENIYENAHVKKGQLIVTIQDIDEMFLYRLESQEQATTDRVEAMRQVLVASRQSAVAANAVVASVQAQLRAYRQVKIQIEAAADAGIESAKNKVTAAERELDEHKAALAQIQADYQRQKKLYEEKITSQLKYQETERKLKETEAKVGKAQAYLASARNDLIEKQRDREAKIQKAQAEIDYAAAALSKAGADVAKADSDVAKAQSEVQKATEDLLKLQTQVARQRSQEVRAPFDGFLTQISPNMGGRILKKSEQLCVIVPDTSDRAVQIWLDGNDAPLVQPGRHVRLQFEGWPAVQFAGWPSVAVGTFGGEVVSVDATDDGKGKFRILVRPDENGPDWPAERFLRQGVRANGWVLLEQVPLWYEIWRNMNGFPPVISMDEPKEKSDKKPKLPKP
jgi:multidrug resistance efflux pump